MTKAQTASERVTAVPRLHPVSPERMSFAPSLEIRAFVLERPHGNLLLYSTTGLRADNVARHYLNHWHESMFASNAVQAPLFVHEADAENVSDYEVAGTFATRHFVDDDFEAIPAPGHTPGATAYLWDAGAHRLLFTGDTIYLDDGEWVAAVLQSSDRARYLESLELIRELDFDVLVPWAATAGRPFLAFTGKEDARRRIDGIIARVRAGGDR